MMRNTARLLVATLVLAVVLSGCTGLPASDSTRTTETTKPTTDTTMTTHSISDDALYLRLYIINNSTAMELSEDERIRFEDISNSRQSVFLKALEQDEAQLDGEFVYDEEERRIKAVLYNGTYYRLNVVKY